MDSLSCAGHASALTALRLLRNYNHLLLPPDLNPLVGQLSGASPLLAPSLLGVSGLSGYHQHVQLPHQHLMPAYFAAECPGSGVSSSSIVSQNSETDHIGNLADRRRGEKRPIPDNQKDDKYFERRKRNNQAAKKSRDARKIREDQIALRACVLEHENASLRAHLAAAREETLALRALLLRDKAGEAGAGPGAAGTTQPDLATSTTTD